MNVHLEVSATGTLCLEQAQLFCAGAFAIGLEKVGEDCRGDLAERSISRTGRSVALALGLLLSRRGKSASP